MKSRNYIWGIVLILLGIIGILDRGFNIHIFNTAIFGNIALLAIGLIFELSYFMGTRNNPGLLVPGGILTTLGTMKLLEYFTFGLLSRYFGAVAILSVAIGLWQLYWFGGKNKGLLIPILILVIVSGVSMLSITVKWISKGLILPVILIAIGGYVLFKKS